MGEEPEEGGKGHQEEPPETLDSWPSTPGTPPHWQQQPGPPATEAWSPGGQNTPGGLGEPGRSESGQGAPGGYGQSPYGAPGPYGGPSGPGGPGPYGGPGGPGGPGPYGGPGGPGGPGPYGGPGGPGGPGPYGGPGGPGAPGPYGGPGGPAPYGGPGGPGGPGGAPPWGVSNQPYGFGPQAPPKKGKGGLIAAVAGGAVVLLILIVVLASSLGGSGKPDTKKIAADVAHGLDGAPGVSYTGDGEDGPASFGVTKAGSVYGSFASGGSENAMVTVGGTSYVKAPQAYWTGHGESSSDAGKADGKWTKASASEVPIDAKELTPGALAQALRQVVPIGEPSETPLGGDKAIKVGSGDMTLLLSTKKPYRLMRVETGGWTLDAKALTSSTVGTVFAGLRSDVGQLKDAVDPSVNVVPGGKLQFGTCNSKGCEIKATAGAAGATSGSPRITMTADITARGKKQGTCTDTATANGTQSVDLACTVRGGWPSFYHWAHNTPGSHSYRGHAEFSVTVNSASDVSSMLSKLSQEQQAG